QPKDKKHYGFADDDGNRDTERTEHPSQGDIEDKGSENSCDIRGQQDDAVVRRDCESGVNRIEKNERACQEHQRSDNATARIGRPKEHGDELRGNDCCKKRGWNPEESDAPKPSVGPTSEHFSLMCDAYSAWQKNTAEEPGGNVEKQ